jgi:MFS family permease
MKKDYIQINFLHILNDGFKASLILFLPIIAKHFLIGMTQVGFLGSVVNSLDIILALPSGYFASKIGGKNVLIGTVFFWSLGFFITGISSHYYLVVLGFIIAGVGFGMFHPVSFALVSHMFDKEIRGKHLGNFTALGEVGRVGLSSFITVIIIYFGWRNSAISISLLLFFIGLYFIYLHKKYSLNDPVVSATKTQTSYRELLGNKKFIFASLSNCLDALASGSLFIFIPFLLLQRNVPYIFVGILTSTFFVGSMFGKILLGRLVDILGNAKVFILSELCMAFFIVVLSNATWLPLIIISSIILGIFTKGTVPVVSTMVSESVEHHVGMEKVFGLNALFVGIASTCAPFILGFLSEKFGIIAAFNVSALFALTAIVPAILFRNFVIKNE